MPSGNFETEWSRPSNWLLKVGSWKLTEIKLAGKKRKKKNESTHEATRSGSGEKREKSQRALLLADGEKCCKRTDSFLKSSAASANVRTSANTASTNVSDTAEHRGEIQDREE